MSLVEAWAENSFKTTAQHSGTSLPGAPVASVATEGGAIFSLEPFDAQITRCGTCRLSDVVDYVVDIVCVEPHMLSLHLMTMH